MNGYEKLLKIMQEEGMKNNPAKIVIGIMKSPTECEVAKNILDQDDFFVAEHLSMKKNVNVVENDQEKQVEKIQSLLKAGDMVAVYRLSDEKYLILDKVVNVDVSI